MKRISVPSGCCISRCAATSYVPGKSSVRAVPVAHDGLPLSSGTHASIRLFVRPSRTYAFDYCINKQAGLVGFIKRVIVCASPQPCYHYLNQNWSLLMRHRKAVDRNVLVSLILLFVCCLCLFTLPWKYRTAAYNLYRIYNVMEAVLLLNVCFGCQLDNVQNSIFFPNHPTDKSP